MILKERFLTTELTRLQDGARLCDCLGPLSILWCYSDNQKEEMVICSIPQFISEIFTDQKEGVSQVVRPGLPVSFYSVFRLSGSKSLTKPSSDWNSIADCFTRYAKEQWGFEGGVILEGMWDEWIFLEVEEKGESLNLIHHPKMLFANVRHLALFMRRLERKIWMQHEQGHTAASKLIGVQVGQSLQRDKVLYDNHVWAAGARLPLPFCKVTFGQQEQSFKKMLLPRMANFNSSNPSLEEKEELVHNLLVHGDPNPGEAFSYPNQMVSGSGSSLILKPDGTPTPHWVSQWQGLSTLPEIIQEVVFPLVQSDTDIRLPAEFSESPLLTVVDGLSSSF